MKRLRVPPLGERKSDLTTLKVGFFTGAFVCLFVTMVISAIFHQDKDNNWRILVRLYRGPMLIALFLFLMGLNVQVYSFFSYTKNNSFKIVFLVFFSGLA